MIEIASCFGDQALSFSSPSCSSRSAKSSYISPSPSNLPSVCNAVTCVYRTDLPSKKSQILVMVTWCRGPGGHRLIVEFGSNSMEEPPCIKIGTDPSLFLRNRGRKSVSYWNSDILLAWDFSNAKFDAWSPEPVSGFSVTISIDSELSLILGRGASSHESYSGKAVLVSKREELSGDGLYSTKVRFGPKGDLHDILVKCRRVEQGKGEGNDQDKPPSILNVYMDRKLVMKVKRLQWNFRGSQTIFMDGAAIDFMWNVHDWFYDNSGTGQGVFMFRMRSNNDDGSHGEDEDEYGDGFCMLICASKSIY
ncbi:hypothetical protein MLD38_025277 [Melastoma candidum]|uniref:Uncharacterized protein n=1 Tax=Melastoma candidum TaxID=119954 RepID=A0ACB9P1T5_9MYRT|nr:hypothetical protein MLD38_025277 [Melastoma candidum]